MHLLRSRTPEEKGLKSETFSLVGAFAGFD